MEGTRTKGIGESERASGQGGGRPYALLALSVVIALVGTVALAVVLLKDDSSGGPAAAPEASPLQQTAFALFDEFHATLIVSPGATGSNTVDLAFATHDGSPVPDFAEVTVTAALPGAGGEPVVFPAEPVSGSPGLYRAELALPESGDWELTLTVAAAGSEPVAETAVVPIGGR